MYLAAYAQRFGATGLTFFEMGVSIESERYVSRVDDLLQVPAAVRFLSVEPLLGPIPDLPSTRAVLNGPLFEDMREGATFINTGRGAQVVEEDLIRVLKERPDLTALLDVPLPEPPVADSDLWTLPNVWISPHVGGSVGDEVVRMADCVIEEFVAWESGKPLRYQVTREVLKTMG